MCEMAYVVQFHRTLYLLTVHRFGGGSEIMRDGDPLGVLTKLNAAMESVPLSASASVYLVDTSSSFLMILDHAPWLGHYVRKIPPSSEALFTFRRLAIQQSPGQRLAVAMHLVPADGEILRRIGVHGGHFLQGCDRTGIKGDAEVRWQALNP